MAALLQESGGQALIDEIVFGNKDAQGARRSRSVVTHLRGNERIDNFVIPGLEDFLTGKYL